MPPFWKPNGNQEEDDPGKAVEKKFETLEASVKEIKDKSVTKEDFQTVAEAVKAMNARQEREDEERRKAAERKAQQQRQEQQENYDPEKEAAEFLGDPRAYINKNMQPTNQATLLALGKQKIIEVLQGKKYYHGQFKTDVDQAILTGTKDYAILQNPEYILNCYRVVLARYYEEDKLKEMKASASLEQGGDASGEGSKTGNTKPIINYRPDTQYSQGKFKNAAEALGLKDEDLIDAAEKGTIKGLEVMA